MQKIKLITLWHSIPALNKMLGCNNKNLDLKAKYDLKRIMRVINPIMEMAQNFNFELREKYGQKNEKQQSIKDEYGRIKICPESIEQYDKELNDYLKQEEEIDIKKMSIKSIQQYELTVGEELSLEYMIDDSELNDNKKE